MRISIPMLGLLALFLTTPEGRADNIDLATVPGRDDVQLTIYNSEDLTLVRETRQVSFKRGRNRLQFSWANTLIDPTSVELRFLSHADRLTTLDTSYPHERPQMLYWNVASEIDGQARVEITYFTSGIRWEADYTAIADPAERTLDLRGFVRVHNGSGEHYENAQVRLVVGTINLVEKIAELARLPVSEVKQLRDERRRALKHRAARTMMALGAVAEQAAVPQPKVLAKEGLSEYFIYTIEGTETIRDGWAKRLRSLRGAAVPLTVEYRYRPEEYGDGLVRLYIVRNDQPSGLGSTPLPNGRVSVFRRTSGDGLAYLASRKVRYVPIGDRMEINLGADPEVVFERVPLRYFRDNLWTRVGKTKVYRRVDRPGVQIDSRDRVAGWDAHAVYVQRIGNYTERPIRVQVRRRLPGHVTFRGHLGARLHDYQTVEYQAEVPAGQRTELYYEVIRHQGHNARQNQVTLEDASVARPSYRQ